MINVHKNTRTVPICALTRSADPRGVAYRPCTFAWGKSCLVLCPRHEDLALSSGALFLRTNNNTHASSSFLRIVSPSGYQMMCRKPLPSIQGSEGLGCSRRHKRGVQTKRNFDVHRVLFDLRISAGRSVLEICAALFGVPQPGDSCLAPVSKLRNV